MRELARDQHRFEGQRIRLEGVVRSFTGSGRDHLFIEDSEQNRVALEGPQADPSLVGLRVEVIGRYGFADDRGRFLQVESIRSSGR